MSGTAFFTFLKKKKRHCIQYNFIKDLLDLGREKAKKTLFLTVYKFATVYLLMIEWFKRG